MAIRPAEGCTKPAIARSTVVLPEPEGPISASTSPGAMVSVRGFSTSVPRYDTLTRSS